MSINASVFKTIEELEAKLRELRKIVGMAEIEAPAAVGKTKKTKKAKSEAESEEKEKRAPTAWNVFCSRVAALIGKDGANLNLGAPLVVVGRIMAVEGVKEKTQENLEAISDDRILEIARGLTRADLDSERTSKAEAKKAKKEASEAGSVAGSEEAPAAAEAAEKPKRTLSEEQKAKMKAGREAAKAKKDAEKATASAAAPAPAAEAAKPAAEAPKPAEEAVAKKPGKQLTVKPKAAPKKLDLRFREWVFEGTSYHKNERGDVIDESLSWIGRYSEEKGEIDTDVEAPEDLGDIELIDE
jgi:hypothetical protein